MSPTKRFVIVALALISLAPACGPFAPPESCDPDLGGTADEAMFADSFLSMELLNESTGQPGPQDSEGGATFAETDPLVIRAETRSEVSVRACVQPRTGGREIPFDQTVTMARGAGSISLGAFQPGRYVVRVIVKGVLVKNLPFRIP